MIYKCVGSITLFLKPEVADTNLDDEGLTGARIILSSFYSSTQGDIPKFVFKNNSGVTKYRLIKPGE